MHLSTVLLSCDSDVPIEEVTPKKNSCFFSGALTSIDAAKWNTQYSAFMWVNVGLNVGYSRQLKRLDSS